MTLRNELPATTTATTATTATTTATTAGATTGTGAASATAVASLVGPDEVISPAEARVRGISRGVLRGPGFRRLDHGLYVRAECPSGFDLWTRTALKLAPDGAALADVTALRLWGIQLPDGFDADRRIHLLLPNGANRPDRGFIAPRSEFDNHTRVVELKGLPVVAAVDAWLEVAGRAEHRELVQIGDGLMRYAEPLATPDQIAAAIGRWSGQRGVAAARAAALDMRPGTDSIKETELRQVMMAGGLPEPELQVTVRDLDGQIISRSDVGYRKWMVLGEYDGQVHLPEAARRRDNTRRRWLEELGYRLVVATAPDLKRPAALIRAFREAIRAQTERHSLAA
jgi:hypothetical protein